MASIAPRIHAILVGMDKYESLDYSFQRAIDDVKAMRGILIKIGVNEKNIQTFENAESTTKQAIMAKIASLKAKADRGDPIIFYYSGYVGTTIVNGRSAKMICPYDVVTKQGGISDIALVQMFDELALFCGNNISVFLDCPIQNFDFGSPTSCVIMGPLKAATTAAGGAFTHAMIKVLSDMHERSQPLDYATVQSFSAHVRVNFTTSNIRCIGSNIDRPLFNLIEKGHYAFVTGQVDLNGRISLNAGAAHGIPPNAVYGIYSTNVRSYLPNARIGELRVVAVAKEDLTSIATATLSEGQRLLPFFFAVEEGDTFEPLPISCTPDVEKYLKLKGYSGWKKVSDSEKPIAILKKVDDSISMTWMGLENDKDIRVLGRKYVDAEDLDASRTILCAARFWSQLAEPSPTSLAPTKMLVRLQRVQIGQELDSPEEAPVELADTERTKHMTLLTDDKYTPDVFLESPWTSGDDPSSYALTITNKNDFNVWLYVYLFDLEDFTIEPWYEASSPLESGEAKVIGTGDDATYFQHRTDKDYDFIYLKIFVAREPFELRFIRQSSFQDKFRVFTLSGQQADKKSDPEAPSGSDQDATPQKRRPPMSKWASMTIRIINKYMN